MRRGLDRGLRGVDEKGVVDKESHGHVVEWRSSLYTAKVIVDRIALGVRHSGFDVPQRVRPKITGANHGAGVNLLSACRR
jgi:hypothetical protein